jgi:heme exporter protein C
MSTERLYHRAARGWPACWALAAASGLGGLLLSLWVAPADTVQGDAMRIVFVHRPALWVSAALWLALNVSALLAWRRDHPVSMLLARAIAPSGALLDFVALWSGALWSKPVRGQWWLPEAPLAAALLMLVGWLAFMVLASGIDEPRQAARAGAAVALAGLPNLLMLAPSVDWQPDAGSAATTGAALALMTLAFAAWAAGAVLHRVRSMVLEAERDSAWALQLDEVQR